MLVQVAMKRFECGLSGRFLLDIIGFILVVFVAILIVKNDH